jgi:hypothetical protein
MRNLWNHSSELTSLVKKDDRQVCVAEETQHPLRRVERASRVVTIEDVVILIERRPVANLHVVVDENRAVWQIPQVLPVVWCERIVRP